MKNNLLKRAAACLLSLCMVLSLFVCAAPVRAENSTNVYFYNYSDSSALYDNVYVYAYANGADAGAAWPGVQAQPSELGEYWYFASIAFDASATPINVIINNNSGAQFDAGYVTANDGNYFSRAGLYFSKAEAEASMAEEEPDDPDASYIYFYNSSNWASVGAYIYGGSSAYGDNGEVLGGWGSATASAAPEIGESWVKVAVSELPPYSIIFYNRENDSQRAELGLSGEDYIYVTATNQSFTTPEAAEDAVNGTPTTVYFLNYDGEGAVFSDINVYPYADNTPVAGGWPGIAASPSGIGDNWYEVSIPRNASLYPFTVIVNGTGADQLGDIYIDNYENNYITVNGLYDSQNAAERSVGIINETVMYYLNSYDWPSVNAYVYGGDAGAVLGGWPGTPTEPAPELGEKWVKVTVPAKQPFSIIFFNTEADTPNRVETYTEEGMRYLAGSNAYGNGGVYSTPLAAELDMGIGDVSLMTTLYFYNYDGKWDDISGYFFTKENEDAAGVNLGAGWPGKEAAVDSETGENWWVISVPQNADTDPFYAIFNDGINQTEDLLIENKQNVYITPGGQLFATAAEAEAAAATETFVADYETGPNEDIENYNVSYPDYGAALPYITYEAESAETNAEVLEKSFEYRVIQTEASGRQAVRLNNTGDYVSFTLTEAANSLVLRYSMPDSSDGKGVNDTLSLYINGEKKQALDVTSKYMWVYGGYPYFNNVSLGKACRFYDETRLLLGETLPAGTVVTLEKDADDTADWYIIDFIEGELVGAPLTQSANSLSVTDFGAVPNDGSDDREAFEAAIAAAKEQGKEVWIPEGTFDLVEMKALVVEGVTVRGAGMWYTNLYGAGAAFKFNGTSKFFDFAMTGVADVRRNEIDPAGFENGGKHASNVTIQNIWMEHMKVGAWTGNTERMVIQGCRIRNVYADGVNLCSGTTDSVIRNNNFRNTGDDCIAIWPWAGNCTGNTISHNTVQAPNLANGIAVYGGGNHVVEYNHVTETFNNGGGIVIGSEFETRKGFTGDVYVRNNLLERTGAMQNDENYPIGAIWVWSSFDKGMDFDAVGAGLYIENNTMLDNVLEGILIEANQPLTGVYINDNTIDSATYAIYEFVPTGSYGGGSGWGRYSGLNATNLSAGLIADNNPDFILEEEAAPEFKSHSLTLGDQIGINFFVDLSMLTAEQRSGVTVDFTIAGKDGASSTDRFDADFTNPKTGEFYGFTCYVNSIQMADTVTATVNYGEGKTVSQEYSVAKYVEGMNANSASFSDEAIALINAIADYGYYSQIFLSQTNRWTVGVDHAAMTPGRDISVGYDFDRIAPIVSNMAFKVEREKHGIEKVSYSLSLDSKTAVNVFLKPEQGYDGKVSARINDDEESVKLPLRSDGRYLITVPNISAHMLGDMKKITVYDNGNDTDHFTVSVSALSYVNGILNGSGALSANADARNAAAALYYYYETTMAYRASL